MIPLVVPHPPLRAPARRPARRSQLQYSCSTRRLVAFLGVLVTFQLGRAVPAWADSAAEAERLFAEGKALMKERRLPEACPKFEASQRLDPAAGTLLALAYCREQAGLLVSARQTYVAAAKLAGSASQEDRVRVATGRAAALQERISTLTLLIPENLSSVEGFQLKLNSVKVDRSTWGAAVPLDQGIYTVEVSAPGHQPWTTTVVLRDEGERQVLAVPTLQAYPPASQPAPMLAARPPARSALVSEASARERGDADAAATARSLRVLSVAAAVASGLSIGTGFAFGVRAASKNDASNAKGHCDERGCDARGFILRNEALSAARASTVLFVTGGVLAAVSLTLYLVAVRSPSEQRPTRLAVTHSPTALGLALEGGF